MDRMEEDYGYDPYDDEELEYYAVRPNKTQIKRDIAALFALAEKLAELKPAQLATLELPEEIRKGITEVAGMPPKGARKRLLKFITQQLYSIDVTPIAEKLARMENKSAHAAREHHQIERWRERLIGEGDDALSELLDEYPDADRQHLRQLLRNAQKEQASAKPPKSSRLLYRYLRSLIADEELDELDALEDRVDGQDDAMD